MTSDIRFVSLEPGNQSLSGSLVWSVTSVVISLNLKMTPEGQKKKKKEKKSLSFLDSLPSRSFFLFLFLFHLKNISFWGRV